MCQCILFPACIAEADKERGWKSVCLIKHLGESAMISIPMLISVHKK